MSSRVRGATSWLVAINVALALLLAALWLAPGAPAAWRNWQPAAPQAPALDDVRAATLVANAAATASYPAVVERPLMDPTRRPQTPASAPSAAASVPPPTAIDQVRLRGIVAGPALNGVLIDQEGKTSFVRRGERVGDWTLESLRGREADFVRNGEHRRIELPVAFGASDPGAAAPGARPAAPTAPRRPAAPAQSAPAPAPAPSAAPSPPPAASTAPPRGGFGGGPPRKPASAPR